MDVFIKAKVILCRRKLAFPFISVGVCGRILYKNVICHLCWWAHRCSHDWSVTNQPGATRKITSWLGWLVNAPQEEDDHSLVTVWSCNRSQFHTWRLPSKTVGHWTIYNNIMKLLTNYFILLENTMIWSGDGCILQPNQQNHILIFQRGDRQSASGGGTVCTGSCCVRKVCQWSSIACNHCLLMTC